MKATFGINSYDGRRDPYNHTFIPDPPFTSNLTWDEYVGMLREAASVSRHPSEKETNTPWSSPMILGDAGHRCLDNVVGMAPFAGFDLDEPGWSLDRLKQRLAGTACILHTTTKSRPAHQRWRAIVRLDREHSVQEYAAVWGWANHHLFDGELDDKTFNANRILYFPAEWEGADNVFAVYDREPLCVDTMVQWYGELPVVTVDGPDSIEAMAGKRRAPNGVAICTPKMIERFSCSPPGGRFWNLLIAAAARYRREDWPLTAQELFEAAKHVSGVYAPGTRRSIREAERALAWVEANIEPMTAMERLQKNLNFRLRHSTKRII